LAVTCAVAIWNAAQGRRKNLKEDYAFAKGFFADLTNADLHPLLREKGYKAIAGDPRITGAEVAYLLRVAPAGDALKDYIIGKHYLTHFATAGNSQIAFKPKYKKVWARRIRQSVYFVMYMIFILVALNPLLIPKYGPFRAFEPISATLLGCLAFLPLAFLALKQAVKISRAEALVKRQGN
jgi:hypothetical protein